MATPKRKSGKSARAKRCGIGSRTMAVAALLAASVASGSAPVFAATGNVTFEGTIDTNASCAITVQQNGRFGISSDFKSLSSKIAGGQVGIADVLAIGSYDISATTFPTFTAAPSGGTTGTTLQSLFSGTSLLFGVNFAERPGTSPVTLPAGLSYTRVNAHLVASRVGSAFPTGFYQGIVVVRCE